MCVWFIYDTCERDEQYDCDIDETLEWLVGDEAGCYRRGEGERDLKALRVGQDYVRKGVV